MGNHHERWPGDLWKMKERKKTDTISHITGLIIYTISFCHNPFNPPLSLLPIWPFIAATCGHTGCALHNSMGYRSHRPLCEWCRQELSGTMAWALLLAQFQGVAPIQDLQTDERHMQMDSQGFYKNSRLCLGGSLESWGRTGSRSCIKKVSNSLKSWNILKLGRMIWMYYALLISIKTLLE